MGKHIIPSKVCYTSTAEQYKVDLTATWTSLHKGSLQLLTKLIKLAVLNFTKLAPSESQAVS